MKLLRVFIRGNGTVVFNKRKAPIDRYQFADQRFGTYRVRATD